MDRQVTARSKMSAASLAFALLAVTLAGRAAADVSNLSFSADPVVTDGYGVTGVLAATDAEPGTVVAFHGRKATSAESSPAAGADGIFFFDVETNAVKVVHVGDGSTIDVRFPQPPNPSYVYKMTLAQTDPNVIDVPGTVRGNTVHFALPSFAMQPGTRIIGEVDGDAPNR